MKLTTDEAIAAAKKAREIYREYELAKEHHEHYFDGVKVKKPNTEMTEEEKR